MVLGERLQARAAQFFLMVIILQIPIFSVPCRDFLCTSPIEIVASQFYTTPQVPIWLIKVLLYPGTFVKHFQFSMMRGGDFLPPNWDLLLEEYGLDFARDMEDENMTMTPFTVELFCGCLLAIIGSIATIFWPSRMSLFGMMLILWGIMKATYSKNPEDRQGGGEGEGGEVKTLVTLYLALVLALFSIRFDATQKQAQKPLAKPFRIKKKA